MYWPIKKKTCALGNFPKQCFVVKYRKTGKKKAQKKYCGKGNLFTKDQESKPHQISQQEYC